MIALSHYQVKPLFSARREGLEQAIVSLDLNLTKSEVMLGEAGVRLPTGVLLTWKALEEVLKHDRACFFLEEEQLQRVHFFSPAFQRAYTLFPTQRAPSMLLASFPMHRIKDIDPHEDTLLKIRAVAPILGNVLDTTMGLGYTAIEAAKTATKVLTLELDPTVLEVAKRNPWSALLFTNPKIERRIGNATAVVKTLETGAFHSILHDPPTLRIAGELYATEFYRELHRLLKRDGRLFHYIGDPQSALGASGFRSVVKRLQEVGFTRVRRVPQAFGVVASR
jgi:predicted methyltransferase